MITSEKQSLREKNILEIIIKKFEILIKNIKFNVIRILSHNFFFNLNVQIRDQRSKNIETEIYRI